ncbi:MAG TPA: endo-1,4-beta-xylanase [Croceibacterium sp.]|nr:endo-1,4-beta-xylanase [Croceibacterium sp.]
MTRPPFVASRRQALAGLAALPLVGCGGGGSSAGSESPDVTTPAPSGFPTPSLNALAAEGGRRFGSAIGYTRSGTPGGSIQNPNYAAVVKAECGLVVPENELKWQWTRPAPDRFDFEAMDGIVRWAQQNGLAVRGHTLLWHRPRWFPEWLNNYDFGATPAREAERLLTEHIRTVTERYDGVITSYDVVNEAIDHDTNGLMQTSLSRAMGSAEAVLDLAFHTARDQLPQGQLVYNDYMSWEPDHRKHVADVLRLLEGFRRRDVPVDALGIQSHIEMYSIDPATGVGPYLEREWRDFLDEVVAMGYRLLITEFDVKDKALPGAIPERDAKVADFTRRYFDVMLDYPQLGDILAWGMVDPFNWLQGFAPRDDGMEVRSSPYDGQYRPKPMRGAIAEALREAVPARA